MKDERKITGYMCGVDWQHELGEASGGSLIFPSLTDLKAYHEPWNECGVVEVETKLVSWVVPQNITYETLKVGEDDWKNKLPDHPPVFKWHKNDPKKYAWFEDGSKFLLAVRVNNEATKTQSWEVETLVTDCDGEGMHLKTVEGEYYSTWQWDDFEYFALLEGKMPTAKPDEERE